MNNSLQRIASSRRPVFVASIALAGVITVGCATNKSATETATEAATEALLPVEEENKLGVKMKAEVDKELKAHPDPEVQAYVRGLGERIVKAAGDDVPEGITFTFTVVDDPDTVNAFAIPGGHIYIYTGLMKLADDEAELMGVMGHEVAHVTKRHIAQRLVGMYGYQSLISLALGEDPGLLGEIVGGIAANGMMLKHGRDHETHADTHGVRYAKDAGSDPLGFSSLFEKMKSANDIAALEILSSHPLPQTRIDHVNAILRADAEKGTLPTERHRDEYQAIKAKIGGTSKPAANESSSSTDSAIEDAVETATEEPAEAPKKKRRRR